MLFPLSPIDRSFIHLDSATSRQQIASLAVLSGPPNEDQLLRRFSELIKVFPKLSMRLDPESESGWCHLPNLTLSKLVQIIRFDEVDNEISPLDKAISYASDLIATPLSWELPPWRYIVVTSPRATIAIFLLHHVLSDGLGGLEVLHQLTSPKLGISDSRLLNTSYDQEQISPIPKLQLSRFEKLVGYIKLLREGMKPRASTPLWKPDGGSSRKIYLGSVPLRPLRSAKASLGVSLNDLLLSSVTKAVAEYHSAHQITPTQITDNLRAIIPVSLRSARERLLLGNLLTGIGIMLPLGESNPIRRTQLIRSQVSNIISKRDLGGYALISHLNKLLPDFLAARLCRAQARLGDLIVTNMPDSPRPRFVAGAEILANFGFPALLQNQGLGFGAVSYRGALHLSLITDPKLVPDGETIMNALVRSLEQDYLDPAQLHSSGDQTISSQNARIYSPALADGVLD